MQNFLWVMIAWLAFGFTGRPASAADNGIIGIYDGQITLAAQGGTIPLQVSLSATGESSFVRTGPATFEERRVIDGAFLVDDEGGPYGFTLVTYNLDKGEVDLRYNRSDLNLGQVASSFRLVGSIGDQGVIRGKVLSGLRGPIGTFELHRVDRTMLKVTKKYQGVWAGPAQKSDGATVDMAFGLGTALRARTNPPTYEFDYTPGKLGYVAWNGVKTHFNQIAIDYLRHRIVFSDTDTREAGQVSTAECEIDPVTHELVGNLYGVFRGKVATFRLKKVD